MCLVDGQFPARYIEMQKQMQRVSVGECEARTRTPAHGGGWWRPPVDPQSSSSVLGSAMLPLAAALLFAAVAVSQTTVPQTSVTPTAAGPPVPDPQACPQDKLTSYRVVLHTFWTREMFPKHYPEWRPPAQWSKLIGESEYNPLNN